MVRDINVYLEPNSNGSYVYYPGHLLKGMVEYPLDHVEKIHCFYVTVVGKENVNWEKQGSVSSRSGDTVTKEYFPVLYWGEEFFVNEETYFMGQKNGPLIALQPGIYRYNFSCQLPHSLPSSLRTRYGEISYCVESNIDLENRYKICFGHTPFSVVSYEDLSKYPELRSPIKIEKVKSLHFIVRTGSIIITVSLPCSGFALGQRIPIKISYDNKSSVDVKQTKINLVSLMQYTCHHPKTDTRKDKITVMTIVAEGVKARGFKEIEALLEIPATLICSNDRYCKIIVVSHTIEIEGELGGLHLSPSIQIPVTIGHLPARALP